MTGWLGILGAVITTLGVIVVAWLTRRTAKDQTAVGGFSALVTSLQAQNDRQEKRIRALEHECERRGIAASVWGGRHGLNVAPEQESLFSKADLAPLCMSCEARA